MTTPGFRIDALRRDQPADLSIDRAPGATEVKLGPDTIARIDERREQLVVYAPADVRPMLQSLTSAGAVRAGSEIQTVGR